MALALEREALVAEQVDPQVLALAEQLTLELDPAVAAMQLETLEDLGVRPDQLGQLVELRALMLLHPLVLARAL